MIQRFLIEFLKQLEAAIPPPSNCHHAITYAQYGSDEAGWTDKLALQVNNSGKFLCFFIDENDLTTTPENAVALILAEMRAPLDRAQFGVSCGQYVKTEGIEGVKV